MQICRISELTSKFQDIHMVQSKFLQCVSYKLQPPYVILQLTVHTENSSRESPWAPWWPRRRCHARRRWVPNGRRPAGTLAAPPRGSPPGRGTCSSRSALPPIRINRKRQAHQDQGSRGSLPAAAGGDSLTGEEGAEADDGDSAAGGGDGGEVRGTGELGGGDTTRATCCGIRSGRRHGPAPAGGRRRGLRRVAEAEAGSREGESRWENGGASGTVRC